MDGGHRGRSQRCQPPYRYRQMDLWMEDIVDVVRVVNHLTGTDRWTYGWRTQDIVDVVRVVNHLTGTADEVMDGGHRGRCQSGQPPYRYR